jgi:hypothetical protein
MDEKIIPCPVCGSTDIGSIIGENDIYGPGYRSWKVHDVCNNCGVFLAIIRKELKKET